LRIKVGYIVAAIVVLLPASCIVHDHNLHASFRTIAKGMSEGAVVSILGRPREIRDCSPGEFMATAGIPDCVETYVYASAWAPLIPEYPVVWFNRDKQVIDKYVFESP
jgi:hypothetical protein